MVSRPVGVVVPSRSGMLFPTGRDFCSQGLGILFPAGRECWKSKFEYPKSSQSAKFILPGQSILGIKIADLCILDTYHDIKGDFCKPCLNEFCYKSNRRYSGFHLFDRLELYVCTYRTSLKHSIC